MARIRSLKPEAFTSETLAQVSISAERTFFGLKTYADDRGRFRDQAALLNGALWPERREHAPEDLEAELAEMASVDLICRYVGCDGKRYAHIITWDRHEKVDNPSKRCLPRCPQHLVSCEGKKELCGRHDDQPCPNSESTSEDSRVLASPRDRESAPTNGSPTSRENLALRIVASPREDIASPSGDTSDGPDQQVYESLARARESSRALDVGPRTLDLGPKKRTLLVSDSAAEDEAGEPADAKAFPPEVEELCTLLADLIEQNGSKRPKVTDRWRDACRLMITRDSHTADQVRSAIQWCQADEFWRGNVLSMPKLRDKYDQLRLAAQRSQNGIRRAVGHQPFRNPTDPHAYTEDL